MINAGRSGEIHWPDNWTATTTDGKRSAQFEETLLFVSYFYSYALLLIHHCPGSPRQGSKCSLQHLGGNFLNKICVYAVLGLNCSRVCGLAISHYENLNVMLRRPKMRVL
jgi:hypothetical protein